MSDYKDEIASLYAPVGAYVRGVVPLMLQHCWQLARRNETSLLEQLRNSLWLARLVSLDARVLSPETIAAAGVWPRLESELCTLLDHCDSDADLPAGLDQAMNLLTPHIELRFIDHYRFPQQPFNCWWYTVHHENTLLALHLVNRYMPESPFRHTTQFARDMLRAVTDGLALYPSITTVECGSWLNEHGRFQRFWPASFLDSRTVLNREGGIGPGAWGQYMAADGSFVTANAEHLIANGTHRFTLTERQCPAVELVDHLQHLTDSKQ